MRHQPVALLVLAYWWLDPQPPRKVTLATGPAQSADGTTNILGALRRAMATTGYSDLKEFQRVEVVVAPYQRS